MTPPISLRALLEAGARTTAPIYVGKPDEDRFWASVKKTTDSKSCWEWLGSTDAQGYGRFWVGRLRHRTHRTSWTIARGEIPSGMFVCHHCDNKRCVRPDHLFLGTASDNQRDAASKGRCYRQKHPETTQGPRHPMVKLTEQNIEWARAMRGKMLQKDIGKALGVAQKTISDIQLGRLWRHLPMSELFPSATRVELCEALQEAIAALELAEKDVPVVAVDGATCGIVVDSIRAALASIREKVAP